ncbi:LmeA family phospholipid-binding protein [Glycomyces tarimensis]
MGKILRRTLVTLVIVVAVVALGDRVANALAERRVATEVADTAAEHGAYSNQRPDVTIHGWPFLTQAWSGEFEQIDIEMRDVGATVEDAGLTFPTLDLVAHDVTADWRDFSDGNSQITAEQVDVSGSISIESLEALLRESTGYDMTLNDDGTASVSAVVEAAGFEVEVVGTGAIELGGGELRFTPDVVEAVTEQLPPEADQYIERVREEMTTIVSLPELPWGVELTEIAIRGGDVEISGSATGVTLT